MFKKLCKSLLLPLLLAGCAGTPPAELYTLAALEAAQIPRSGGVAVGVGPVKLPEYLDQPQMLTRPSPTRMQLHETQRWAAPLQATVTRVMAQNLAVLLDSGNVLEYPWDEPFEPEYRVLINFRRLEGDLNGETRLEARWSIVGKDRRKLLLSRQSELREAAGAPGYDALAQAQSRALQALSREITAALAELAAVK
jgi:uncharacterized lipoprotein YmbA